MIVFLSQSSCVFIVFQIELYLSQPKRAQAQPSGSDQELDEDQLLLPSHSSQEQVLAAGTEISSPSTWNFPTRDIIQGSHKMSPTSPSNCHFKWLRKYTMCNLQTVNRCVCPKIILVGEYVPRPKSRVFAATTMMRCKSVSSTWRTALGAVLVSHGGHLLPYQHRQK